MHPSYGITKDIDAPFDQVVERVTAALKEQGFGVLTTIDMQATMKAKLDKDLPRYLILGACNPPLAYQALQKEPWAGLLLPCNVVIQDREEGGVTVSAVDPGVMFKVVPNEEVAPIAKEVEDRLRKAMDAL